MPATRQKTQKKPDVQFIRAPGGAELAVLPRAEYDRLVALAEEAREDIGTARVVRNSKAAITAGREVVMPKTIVDKLMDGENPIRAIRKWRDMIQGETRCRRRYQPTELRRGLESGKRKGPAEYRQNCRVHRSYLSRIIVQMTLKPDGGYARRLCSSKNCGLRQGS